MRGADYGEMRESYELRSMMEERAVQLAQKDGNGLKPLVELHKGLCARLRAQDVPGATDEVRKIFQRISAVFELA